ncbi:MAG: hypothetical protein K8T89_26890, partial [Planctomycetes bacterium]|nr:hypothetical protein [Planctomycetota bacterium]
MVKFACYLVLALLPTPLAAAEIKVSIRADFPGGNVVVVKNEGNTIELAPDLRGGRPWFYWYFEAEASQPGKVTFAFANPPMVGVRGPAISLDDGKSWQWHGAEHVAYAPPPGKDGVKQRESFTYEFTAKNLKVRFAVVIPYGQSELDEFLKKHGKNPHLTQKVLTKSTKGKAVELFQIGKPGPNVKTLLLTARHHACETMASYVLEGFIEEALSDSPAGVAFRKRFALFVVPFVDKDGVLAGDQGKNRNPHDHNRDYG